MEQLKQLRDRLGEVADINAAIALLEWDQETYMPLKAADSRSLQLATISTLAHNLFTDPAVGDLLNALRDASPSVDPDDRSLIEETLYDYERATHLPASFVQSFSEARSRAFQAWLTARQQSDFALFEPHLRKIVELVRQKADLLGYEQSPYNALLEEFERGMTTEYLQGLFAILAREQSALVTSAASTEDASGAAWLDQTWDVGAQWSFTTRVLTDMGFDFDAGRQDRSVHPFTTGLDIRDVRITTRLDPRLLFSALQSSMHEGGHALYDQGYQEKDARTPLAQAPSLGMHESQSRLWENQIGRSLPFWEHYLPVLREHFPGQLDNVGAQDVYRAVNRVQPSFIRVEADECTYNLHVIVRFELELALVEGRLDVAEVPSAWNAKMKEYLGIDVPDDAHGCLQDIHWSHGAFGYFPTYALGNLYAAQLFDAVLRDIPGLWSHVAAGEFQPLREWLREHIHRYGRRKRAREFVRDISGAEPTPEPFMRHLRKKYTRDAWNAL